MVVVFVVLAILMLTIMAFARADSILDRKKKAADRGAPGTSAARRADADRDGADGAARPSPEIVAALAVALALAESEESPQGEAAPAGGPDAWVMAGRRRALESGAGVRR